MPAAFFILVACQVAGESLRQLLRIPVPGSVIGLFLLAAGLVLRDRRQASAQTPPTATALDRLSGALLSSMGLLFVPAGVGVVTELGLLHDQWLPIAAGLVGSTVLGLVVTGVVMHRAARATALNPLNVEP